MKLFKPALWALVAYQTLVGVAELTWVQGESTALAGVAAWPSIATSVDSVVGTMANANVIEGSIDLAAAGAVWWAFLR